MLPGRGRKPEEIQAGMERTYETPHSQRCELRIKQSLAEIDHSGTAKASDNYSRADRVVYSITIKIEQVFGVNHS